MTVVDQAPIRLMDRFVVRSTGFPIEMLTPLRMHQTAQAAERAVDAQDAVASTCDELVELCVSLTRRPSTSPSTTTALRRLRQSATLGRPITLDHLRALTVLPTPALSRLRDVTERWNQVLQMAQAAENSVAAAHTTHLVERRRYLRKVFCDPAVREALWLSNPDMFERYWPSYARHWDADRRNSRMRRMERTLYSYLQRLCTKNDTTSFFGPLNYGRFMGSVRQMRLAAGRIRRRQGYVAFWAAQRIFDHAQNLAHTTEHTRLGLDPASLTPIDDVEAWLRSRSVEEPVLMSTHAVARELKAAAARFAVADLVERQTILTRAEDSFTTLIGGGDTSSDNAPRRSGDGRMFRDRTLLYEECLGDIETLDLTRADRHVLESTLTPVAQLVAEQARRTQHDLQEAGRRLLLTSSPHGRPMSFARFAAEWRRRYPDGPPMERRDAFIRQLTKLVGARTSGVSASVSAGDVTAMTTTRGDGVVMSPDLMFSTDGWGTLCEEMTDVVVGEIHHGVQPAGWMLEFVDDPVGWYEAIRSHLPVACHAQPANLVLGRAMKIAPPRFPGPSVVVSAPVGRMILGLDPGATVVELKDLSVVASDDGPHLLAPGCPLPIRFHPPSHGVGRHYAPFACFSYPFADLPNVHTGTVTPRITVGGVTMQRRRWTVPVDDLAADLRSDELQFVGVARWRRRWGLPAHLFVRTSGEPKPLFVDATNPFAVDLLHHVVSVARGTGAPVVCEELHPDFEHLWLRRRDGHYCAELRMLCSVQETL